ncbi:MAG TPA: enolase, partial [Candidatus Aenigmarchaeota archaeon]|nr:enolase [Candidatus Aenigmarchaeota archaeon]
MKIDCISLRKIFNSRGEETAEAIIFSKDKVGIGSSPSGASVSSKEAKLINLDIGIKNF